MNQKPLVGVKVVEFEGIGPCPLAGMMLADMGAEVTLIGRKVSNKNAAKIAPQETAQAFYHRGKKSILIDLKQSQGVALALKLVAQADVLIEGFRPGVMERLGLGPDVCLDLQPKLVYGRLTGWGQTGPLAQTAGHDPNYIALSGAMYYGARPNHKPTAPLTLAGDVAGGTMMLLWGVMCALWQAQTSGQGQVVDAAITDGSAYASSLLWMMHNSGQLPQQTGESWADGAAPWNDTYECADGLYVNICALEPKFYHLLLEHLELMHEPSLRDQWDKALWPQAQQLLARVFASQSRKHWCDLLEGTDVCFAPVLNFNEARDHPHNLARNTFMQLDGITQPAPAPKMAHVQTTPESVPEAAQDTLPLLDQLGLTAAQVQQLQQDGVV
ncbi:MAG TPA: CoA transferase [Oceanospirillaceae bacterium]|nr:CoA transferase [Oceanospirillaceae bacterium]